MNIDELINLTEKLKGGLTDYGLAKELEVRPQVISAWRKRTQVPNEYHCCLIAEITGIEIAKILAIARLEKEKNPKIRQYWLEKLAS